MYGYNPWAFGQDAQPQPPAPAPVVPNIPNIPGLPNQFPNQLPVPMPQAQAGNPLPPVQGSATAPGPWVPAVPQRLTTLLAPSMKETSVRTATGEVTRAPEWYSNAATGSPQAVLDADRFTQYQAGVGRGMSYGLLYGILGTLAVGYFMANRGGE